MTEAERYQGKLYVPKESQDKGQKKQDSWIENIIKYIETGHGGKETPFLKTISQHPNVPRKKPKFVNFAKSVLKLHDQSKIETIWSHVMKANEAARESTTQIKSDGDKSKQRESTEAQSNEVKPEDAKPQVPENCKDSAANTDDGPPKKKMKSVSKTDEECDEETRGDENEDKNAIAENKQSNNQRKRKGKEKIEKYRWKTHITSILSEMGAMKLRKIQSRLYIRYKKQVDPEKQEDKETVYSRIAQAIEKSSKVTFTPENNMVTLNKNSHKDEE